MHTNYCYLLLISILTLVGCEERSDAEEAPFPAPKDPLPDREINYHWHHALTREIYEDKVLGMLVGSAIGDAMGAPTEMWLRNDIKIQHGYIDEPESLIREGAAEGPWAYNMVPGGTTDDTRWKYLFAKYVSSYGSTPKTLIAKDFAQYITDLYLIEKEHLKEVDEFLPDELETQMRHMTWLQEWVRVAQPYLADDIDGYSYAVSKFYGGEMSCAGMLYAPMVGAYYPGAGGKAYREAYQLGIFDLGYARDITGLTAAYVAKAMEPGSQLEDITGVTLTVDPNGYARSRLVGRIAHRMYMDAKRIVHDAKNIAISAVPSTLTISAGYPYDSLTFLQTQDAYQALDEHLQDIPFHAGEIHLINLTALMFGEGDFKKTIEFVVNYGRDNDTVAAVTGAILGAHLGAKGLPTDWVTTVITTNRDDVGIDLQQLAAEVVSVGYGGL